MQNSILIKTPQSEMTLEDVCYKQFVKVNSLMYFIEKEFNTDMHKHEKLRHEILDISNFIKRLPQYVNEVVAMNEHKE